MWQYSLNQPKQAWRQWLLALAVVVISGIFEWVGLLTPVRGFLETLARPALVMSTGLLQAAGTPAQIAIKSYTAARRIQELEQRYAEVLAQVGELETLRTENTELKKLFAGQAATATNAVTLANPILSLATPAIARGEVDGIRSGQMVTISGIMVGTIGHLSPHQAEVVLLNSKMHHPVLAETESGIQGLVMGDGRNVLLTELPKDTQLQVGERVVSAGQPGIPKNTLIGQIVLIRKNDSAPVTTAVVDPIVSFYQASLVEIR